MMRFHARRSAPIFFGFLRGDERAVPVKHPFKRTVRMPYGNSGAGFGKTRFVVYPGFADNGIQYYRSVQSIISDFRMITDYISPDQKCFDVYSIKVHQLLVRTCIEIEANLKAILRENDYGKKDNDLNMSDYSKVNRTHFLSHFEVRFEEWFGEPICFRPFEAWGKGERLGWYRNYNNAKHDRHHHFERANFGSACEALAGLIALTASQFGNYDFKPNSDSGNGGLVLEDGFHSLFDGRFLVRTNPSIPEDDQYYVHWKEIKEPGFSFPKLVFD